MSQTLEIQESEYPCFQESDKDEEQEEEEEALSLCDLPVTSSSSGNKEAGKEEEENQTGNDSDFDFGSLIGSVTALESEMCAADEIFSGGQMLPFRHSVSSEGGLSGFRPPIRSLSRSDSMDRTTALGPSSRSSSSRSSSSTRSQQSATSSTSSGSSSSMGLGLSLPKPPKPKPKTRNHFHTHPSPNPQIRASGARSVNPKSTMWQVLRLGLVRTPEIELQDLRVRSRTSSNKNTTVHKIPRNDSTSSSSSTDECNKIGDLLVEMQKRRNQISNVSKSKNGGGIFGSCKCSIGAIEPIIMPPPRVNYKPNYLGGKSGISSQNSNKLLLNHQLVLQNEDKVLAQKKNEQHQQQQQQEQQQGKREKDEVVRQGKRVVSHHRTFEWLRDLSHTSVLNS